MLPKNAQGPNVVQASSGSGKFLAGLGAMVSGGLAMSRRRAFEDELHERRKDLATHNATLDIVKKAMGYDLEQQHTKDMIPVMETGNLRKAGQLVRQAKITYEGQKPNPEPEQEGTPKGDNTQGGETTPKPSSKSGGSATNSKGEVLAGSSNKKRKGAGTQTGKPTTDDVPPQSSSSKMKPNRPAKPTVSGRAKRTRIADVEAAVEAKQISPAEAAELNTTYAARIGRAKASTRKTPAVKTPKPMGGNGNSRSKNGNKGSK